jgi:hypothetical protein
MEGREIAVRVDRLGENAVEGCKKWKLLGAAHGCEGEAPGLFEDQRSGFGITEDSGLHTGTILLRRVATGSGKGMSTAEA